MDAGSTGLGFQTRPYAAPDPLICQALRGAFARSPLPSPAHCASVAVGLGDQSMRILTIMVLMLTLVGCKGDRVEQGMNSPQGSIVKNVIPSAGWSSSG